MKEIVINNVNCSYSAYVDSNLIATFPSKIPHECQPKKIVIIIDKYVNNPSLNTLVVSLEKEGFIILIYTLATELDHDDFLSIQNFILYLTENDFEKSDLLVAFGDSKVCNFTGFFSALYMYGVSYINIPTTLLAMIRTSISDENTLNTVSRKNIIGTLHSPIAVLCDIDMLKTLSHNQIRDGVAEIIKYAFLKDSDLIQCLERFSQPEDIISLISKCLRIKNHFTSNNDFNTGTRRCLNFGHTISTALEQHSNYKLTYGQALSAGMSMVTKVAEKHTLSRMGTYKSITKTLSYFNLPYEYDIPLDNLIKYIKKDNIISNNKLSLVVLKKITEPIICDLNLDNLYDFFSVLY